MNSLPEILITALISFGVGFAVGQLVEFRRDIQKKVHIHLTWHFPGDRWVKMVVVILFFFSTAFLVNFTYDQRQCNQEFQRSAKVAREATAASDKALYAIVVGLLTIPETSTGNREKVQDLLREYKVTYDQKLTSRDDNPYPRC